MRNITEEARLVMNTRRNFVNYAHVTLHDGTELNLTPSDFRISGNSFTDDWNEGEAFQLGSAIGKTATLLLDNTDGRTEEIEGETVVYPHGKFSEYDFYMSYFELYEHLPDATHYQGELIDEVIPIGTFTVTTPASHGATIEITGVDNMYMFDKPFNDCTLNFDYHPTLLTVLNRCCQDCGVAIGYTGFTNETLTVSKKPKDITYRQVVSYIAQIAGCNAVIGTTGALQLKWYDMAPVLDVFDGGRFLPWDGVDNVRDTLDGGSFNPWTEGDIVDGGDFATPLGYHNLTATNGTSISTDDIQFTGVMVSYEVVNEDGNTETQSLHYPNVSNWDTYAMRIEQNPFIESQSIATIVANTIWSVIGSLKFRVFSCSSIQDPTIEAGDCALVYDVKGNVYPTIITNVTFKTGGMTDVSCSAESPLKQNTRYVNPAARAVAVAEQRQDDYNAMVAHFNELAYASTGYYITEVVEQGATITYRHDRPTLAASTNIIKITSTGTFISTDGGQSYNAGVDISTATMLMNLIYVKGIQADWIKVNQLSAISANMGTVYVGGGSNGNGILYVRNASNTNIVTLNNTGIAISEGKLTLGDKATLIDAYAGVYIASDGIALGANSVFKVTSAGALNAQNVSIKGEITATSGKIGSNANCWNIGEKSIYNGCTGIDNTTAGTYVGIDGIRNQNGANYVRLASGTLTANNVNIDGGDINMNNGAFHVSSAGALTATSATIEGKITATSGTIGSNSTAGNRWQIGSKSIYNGCTGYNDETNEGTYVGTDGIRNNHTHNEGEPSEEKRYVRIYNGILTANSVNITGGKLAGLTVEDGEKGLSYNDKISGTDYYFKISAYGGVTCGTKISNSWRRMDYVTSYGMLKVDYANATGQYRGFLATAVGNNTYNDPGSSFAYMIADGVHVVSDRRSKKEITDLPKTLSKNLILNSRPVRYKFKEGEKDRYHYGFIAQELEELLPENNGVIEHQDEESLYSMNYQELIAPLIKVVQEQQAEIDDLKARLTKLESIVNTNV